MSALLDTRLRGYDGAKKERQKIVPNQMNFFRSIRVEIKSIRRA